MAQQPGPDPKEIFLRHFWYRFYKALDYLTLFAYALIVALGAFFADYILVYVIGLMFASTVSKYPFVQTVFDLFQIGSATLALVAAFVLSLFSAWSQMRFAYETTKEPILGNQKDE